MRTFSLESHKNFFDTIDHGNEISLYDIIVNILFQSDVSVSAVLSLIKCFSKKDICRIRKTNISGNAPKNLKVTQISVLKQRQITSFNPAKTRKNAPKRTVNPFQPSSSRFNISSKSARRKILLNLRPINRSAARAT